MQYYLLANRGRISADPTRARHDDTPESTAATAHYTSEAYRSRSQEGQHCRPGLTGGVPGFNGGVNGGTEPAPLNFSDNTKDSQTLLLLVPVKTR